MTADMRSSWLIQQLEKPRKATLFLGKDNPFSFGGGLLNGGLKADAMDLLRPIFGFHYMCAAEYEFGDVPRAFQKLVEYAQGEVLFAGEFTIPLRDVPENWRAAGDRKRAGEPDPPDPEGCVSIYTLSHVDHLTEVVRRVMAWAHGSTDREFMVRDDTRLSSALRPYSEWDGEVQGWLELDNGFMFFTDETMWKQTAAVFGVNVDGEDSCD